MDTDVLSLALRECFTGVTGVWLEVWGINWGRIYCFMFRGLRSYYYYIVMDIS